MNINDFRQFIVWREEPPVPPATKPRKVPFNHLTRLACNPHEPQRWMSRDEAETIVRGWMPEGRSYSGRPLIDCSVGFVLTDADPFFFLDLDECRSGDGWDEESTAVYNLFPGAAAEISINRNGLHIMGRCDQQLLRNRAHKFDSPKRPKDRWIEFYTTKRFIALGHGFNGDFNLDWTAQLLGFVPEKPASEEIDFEGEFDPKFTGVNWTIEQTISKMLSSQPSAKAAFGEKATIQQLWNIDVDALAQVYPSANGDVFDRSSALGALIWNLAFWCGRNAARMFEIVKMSPLYEAHTKRHGRDMQLWKEINAAVAEVKNVYDHVPVADQTGTSTGGTLFPDKMQEWFDGCVFVSSINRIFDSKTGQLMKPEAFKVIKGGKRFVIDWEPPQNIVTNAFVAFTENRIHKFPQAFATVFRPALPTGAIIYDEHGQALINIYKTPAIGRAKGDVTLFLNHMKKILPDDRDRQIVISWMARCVQRPGKKIRWSPVIISTEGAGKNVIKYVLRHAVGRSYAYSPNAQELKASGSKFNAWAETKVLVFVDEIKTDERRDLLEILKPLISEDEIEIQGKGADQRMGDSVANWLFCSNYADAVPITTDSRRYAVFISPLATAEDLKHERMDDAYFASIFGWLENGGSAIVAEYLHTFPIPFEMETMRAPKTTTTGVAIEKSLTGNQQIIMDAIEDGEAGFRNGWASSTAILRKLEAERVKPLPITNTVSKMMAELGYRLIGRATSPIFEEDRSKPRLYYKGQISPEGRTEAYRQAQGYMPPQKFGWTEQQH